MTIRAKILATLDWMSAHFPVLGLPTPRISPPEDTSKADQPTYTRSVLADPNDESLEPAPEQKPT